jgi:1-acyl-sn-glycerol-3-phosphate acyltransferase
MRKGPIGFWMRLVEVIVRPTSAVMTSPTWIGQENIPAAGPAILVMNHLSHADPFVAGIFVFDRPRTLRFLAKASLWRIPLVGTILRRIHQIPVYRYTTKARSALEAAQEALAEGHAVVIYPEGTCTQDPDLWPMEGKTGAARLALLSGAPVIPVANWGAQAIHHPITRKWRPRWRTPVTVSAGPPIDMSAFAGAPPSAPETLRGMTDIIMRRLRADVAAIRGVPAPEGPLWPQPVRSRPPEVQP